MKKILVNLVICALCVLGPTDLYAKAKKKHSPKHHHRHSETTANHSKRSRPPKAKNPAKKKNDDSQRLLAIKKTKPPHTPPPPPLAKRDPRVDPSMEMAARIGKARAAHSKSKCWRWVKFDLRASGAVNSYPDTGNAKQAGIELVKHYGFKVLDWVLKPALAPIGAVLVYEQKNRPGHVEIRTRDGFVSDFWSRWPITDTHPERNYKFLYAVARLVPRPWNHK